jgi:hypothetical protein
MNLNDLMLAPSWKAELLQLYRPCRQRILMVTDGSLNYDPADGFGLSELVAALQDPANGSGPVTITKAHRAGGAGADINSFRFDTAATAVTRANYDQLWLFGIASSETQNTVAGSSPSYNPALALSNAEITIIARFMQAGGGVFATGDHGRLGFSLCGLLPRVRQMREWRNIPMGFEGVPTALARIDTVVNPGANSVYEFNDQSDDIPQRIYPHYRQATPMSPFTAHPLLSSPAGDIDVFPDHPHESVCLTASLPGATFSIPGLSFAEFPATPAGVRPLPGVVATSVSGGRAIPVGGFTKPPVTPRCFAAITAYDGDSVDRGRVVCDSTWHHFVNINLNGVGSGRMGLRDAGGNPTAAYKQIKRYYGNIARWLAPEGRRLCPIFIDIIDVRFKFPLIEELPEPVPPVPPFPLLLEVGVRTQEALAAEFGAGMAAEMASELVATTGAGEELRDYLVASKRRGEAKEDGGLLVSAHELRMAALGGMMLQLARELPAVPYEVPKALGEHKDDAKETAMVAAGVDMGLRAGLAHLAGAAQRSIEFLQRIDRPAKEPVKDELKLETREVITT